MRGPRSARWTSLIVATIAILTIPSRFAPGDPNAGRGGHAGRWVSRRWVWLAVTSMTAPSRRTCSRASTSRVRPAGPAGRESRPPQGSVVSRFRRRVGVDELGGGRRGRVHHALRVGKCVFASGAAEPCCSPWPRWPSPGSPRSFMEAGDVGVSTGTQPPEFDRAISRTRRDRALRRIDDRVGIFIGRRYPATVEARDCCWRSGLSRSRHPHGRAQLWRARCHVSKAGGQYIYLRESISPSSRYLYGWTLFR